MADKDPTFGRLDRLIIFIVFCGALLAAILQASGLVPFSTTSFWTNDFKVYGICTNPDCDVYYTKEHFGGFKQQIGVCQSCGKGKIIKIYTRVKFQPRFGYDKIIDYQLGRFQTTDWEEIPQWLKKKTIQ